MTQMQFEEKLMELEAEAIKSGMSHDDIISAYELRSMAVQEEADSDE